VFLPSLSTHWTSRLADNCGHDESAELRAEAVLVSADHDEMPLDASERQQAVAALASVRAEGLEPTAEDLALFTKVAAGELTTQQLREQVLSRCWSRRRG
jgi:hypothetical protein